MMRGLHAGLVLAMLGLAGCSGSGAEGQAVPPQGVLDHLQRPGSSNTALAGPAGFVPKPDIVTRVYDVPPQALYAAVTRLAEGSPRTFKLVRYDEVREAAYVARSRVFNFPDVVEVKVAPSGAGSTLVIYSASVYGESDFGVNRKRIEGWLAALDADLKP
jgi:uncharacterized protein (DUF1499 family)